MFVLIKENKELFEQYLNFYLERFVYASIEIEGYTNEESREIEINNLFKTVNFLYNSEEYLNLYLIEEIGNMVNANSGIAGFRKINVLSGSDFEPVEPRAIRERLYSLLDNYFNIWNILDPFERESMFFVNFMRIHPFEDGNKRVSKLILNNNLIKANLAPVIITDEDNDLLYEYINNYDYKGLTQFLRQRSSIEKNTMVGFLKTLGYTKQR